MRQSRASFITYRSAMRPVLVLVLAFLVPSIARAQFLPERGPTFEQQEMMNVILLAPEATIMGGLIGGGTVFLVSRECCTEGKDSDEVDPVPVAIGAGVGAAIATTWSVIAISDNYHPGSYRNAVLGGALGTGLATAIFFGGPAVEDDTDQILRFLTGIFVPGLAAYAGWHLDSGFYYLRTQV